MKPTGQYFERLKRAEQSEISGMWNFIGGMPSAWFNRVRRDIHTWLSDHEEIAMSDALDDYVAGLRVAGGVVTGARILPVHQAHRAGSMGWLPFECFWGFIEARTDPENFVPGWVDFSRHAVRLSQ